MFVSYTDDIETDIETDIEAENGTETNNLATT